MKQLQDLQVFWLQSLQQCLKSLELFYMYMEMMLPKLVLGFLLLENIIQQ